MGVDSCIGDLCVPAASEYVADDEINLTASTQDLWAVSRTSLGSEAFLEPEIAEDLELKPACSRFISSDNKLMLMPIVPMYHGSTALESVFMSSSKVTTLCSAKTWQCEARLDFNGRAECIRENLLPRYAEYWDMSKPVLFEKGPRGMYDKVLREYPEIQKEQKEQAKGLMDAGFGDLSLAYIIMWRPVCMSVLSSHARIELKKDPLKFARDELEWFEDLVKSHKYLTAREIPVLVTSLGDMMWNEKYSRPRMLEFVPCVGEIDFDYVPQKGTDIFPGNEWKAEGSLRSFGKSVNPKECCGYDVVRKACRIKRSGYVFDVLPKAEKARADAAVAYLHARS